MSKPARRDAFPRGPLLGMFALVAFALVAATAGSLAGHDMNPTTAAQTLQRDLRFEDRADGAVVVYAGNADRPLDVVTGESGFLRGTLRGLARARHSEGIGPGAPFRLTAWADGRLTLDDPSTGRRVELEAFGSANLAVFARLLTMDSTL